MKPLTKFADNAVLLAMAVALVGWGVLTHLSHSVQLDRVVAIGTPVLAVALLAALAPFWMVIVERLLARRSAEPFRRTTTFLEATIAFAFTATLGAFGLGTFLPLSDEARMASQIKQRIESAVGTLGHSPPAALQMLKYLKDDRLTKLHYEEIKAISRASTEQADVLAFVAADLAGVSSPEIAFVVENGMVRAQDRDKLTAQVYAQRQKGKSASVFPAPATGVALPLEVEVPAGLSAPAAS